jgi:NADP-dependent 3-hydroxy acid dehydrogenase YdfG
LLAVNLTGPFLCTQAAAPLIRDSGGGAIVNITSISGLRASTLRTAYGVLYHNTNVRVLLLDVIQYHVCLIAVFCCHRPFACCNVRVWKI